MHSCLPNNPHAGSINLCNTSKSSFTDYIKKLLQEACPVKHNKALLFDIKAISTESPGLQALSQSHLLPFFNSNWFTASQSLPKAAPMWNKTQIQLPRIVIGGVLTFALLVYITINNHNLAMKCNLSMIESCRRYFYYY